MSDHDDDASDINNDNSQPQQQQNIQPQIITTVLNNNAKFPYLKKDKYKDWKRFMMEGSIILPQRLAVMKDIAVRGSGARNKWNAVNARECIKGYDRMQKDSSQLTKLKAKQLMKTSILSFFSEVAFILVTGGFDLNQVRVNKFKKKAGRKIEFDKKEASRFNKKAVRCYKCLQKGHFARERRAKGGNERKEHESGDDEGFAPKEYGMVAGCGAACEEGAAKVYSLITGMDSTDLDETQMTYGKKSTCSIDSISVSNDFVSCDNSDKSSKIKSNDYAFCVSSVKSSESQSTRLFFKMHLLSVEPDLRQMLIGGHSVNINYVPQSVLLRPPPVHAGRRNSFSVTSGWWQSTARPMTHFPTPERLDGLSNLLKVAKVTIGGGKRANNEKGTNQDPSTQDVSSNPAGFQGDDSNSDRAYKAESYGTKSLTSDDLRRLGLGFAKDAEELQKRASAKTVPPGSIPVPTGSIPVPSGDTMVSPSEVSVPTSGVPVPSGSNKEAITQTFCIVCFACFLSVEPRVLAQDLETKVDTQNKRDARGIVSETRLRLVAQGHRWSVGFDYDEEDVKSATSHSTKSLVWKPLSTFVLNMFTEVGTIDKTLLFKMQKEISSLDLKKFDLENVRTATTPYEAPKPKSKNEPDNPDKSVTPTIPNLEAVKRIFNLCIIKAKPTLGLWSLELGPPTILATIDETPYTITEDSVRSQLQLADDGGIDDLPIAEIYSGMDNLGYVTEGEGAGVAAQAVPLPIPETIPETRPDPNQPQDHLSTPPRQQTSDHIASVFEHGQSSDPNIASFSRAYETDDEPFTSTNVEDEPLGGSFHASPPRSTQAPPAGHTSGGTEDLITLTALSSVVTTFV
ncbi:hypothetical protein Tco_0156002 [Tanacetum coccineum]